MDKIRFIEEKKISKEIEKKQAKYLQNKAVSDPIKSKLTKYHLDKKQFKPDDLI